MPNNVLFYYFWNMLWGITSLRTRFGHSVYCLPTLWLWVWAFNQWSDHDQTPNIIERPLGIWLCDRLSVTPDVLMLGKESVFMEAYMVAATALNFREQCKAFCNMVQNKTVILYWMPWCMTYAPENSSWLLMQDDVCEKKLGAGGRAVISWNEW